MNISQACSFVHLKKNRIWIFQTPGARNEERQNSDHLMRGLRFASTRAQFPTGAKQSRPKLADFRWPLLNTFLVALATCAGLNSLWYALEYKEEHQKLQSTAAELENKIQDLVDAKKARVDAEVAKSKKSWWKIW